MNVEQTNQIWFPWRRCCDGYEIHADEAGVPWVRPLSANSEKTMPLDKDPALFRQFSVLDEQDPQVILGFINNNGLDRAPLEEEPLIVWQAEIGRMHAGVNAWVRKDFDGLAVRFNNLNMGAVHLRLEPHPRLNAPILYIQPRGLFLALWVQFAHAITHNLTQRQCDHCRRWYPPQTKRSHFCSSACRAAKHYQDHKE